jgi:carbonic anhydrase
VFVRAHRLGTTSLCLFFVGSLTACVHPGGEDHPHWAYEGEAGPGAWGHLSAQYQPCAAGRHQSPVNVDTEHAAIARLPTLSVHYAKPSSAEVNNGHTVQVLVQPGDFIRFGHTRFELEQFHLHHPSEHILNGLHFPLEIHFVHRSKSAGLLVMAVFVQEGAEHSGLHALFDHLPGDHETVKVTADLRTLLPNDDQFVEYRGSLTTPPCSEGVTWLIRTTPIFASMDQIDRFASLFPHNNRPLMPLNERPLLRNR